MNTLRVFNVLALALMSSIAYADLHLWVGDSGTNFNDASWQTFDSEVFAFPRTNPGAGDLAVFNNESHLGALGAPAPGIVIDSNVTVDSLRFSNGGSATQSAGTLTISNAVGGDIGLWVGEFGPSVSSYTLNGGTIDILDNDTIGNLQVGRGGEATFDFTAGTINMVNDGNTIIGLDGTATWNQSGGVFNAHKVDIGLFQSPTATVNLSGNATWQLTDGLLLSDGSTGFANALSSDLNLTGSNVTLQANGLIVREKGNINYTADGSGISTIVQTGGLMEIQGAGGNFPGLSVDLTSYATTTDTLTLIDAFSLPAGQFDGLPEGATVPGSDGRLITYRGGIDGFDVQLVPAADYVAPPVDPPRPDAAIARWSMDPNPVVGSFPEGNPKILDSRLGANEGTISVRNDVPAAEDNLFFFSADSGHVVVTSTDVAPTSMFANGNNAGSNSYDAGSSVPNTASEGALFFPQDIAGNEFAFTDAFSVEAFFNTSENSDIQQLLLQGEAFARFGITLNEDQGGVRFFVNDGTTIETIDIGGTTGEGLTNYADGEWHYLLATYEPGAGAGGVDLLTLAVANEDGTASQVTRDLPVGFLGLPVGNDSNLFIGTENFGLDADGDGPRRFAGLIDEIQISSGIVPANERLGVLNLVSAGLAGDFNNDGMVDAADYTVWRDNLGGDASNLNGNGDGDSDVDVDDYNLWVASFGNSSSSSTATAIPEPSSLVMSFIVFLGLSTKPRR